MATSLVYSVYQTLFITPVLVQAEVLEYSAALGPDTNPHRDARTVGRFIATAIANFLVATSLSLILLGSMTLHDRYLSRGAPRIYEGAYWGTAIWFVIYAMPILAGLTPRLPGSGAATLLDRQLIWLLASVSGLVAVILLAYAEGLKRVAGILIPLAVAAGFHYANSDSALPSQAMELELLQQKFLPLTALGTMTLCITSALCCAYCYRRWITSAMPG